MTHLTKFDTPASRTENTVRTKSTFVAPFVLCFALALSGCANRIQHIEVGAIPDDYRTRHPIVIAEQDQTLDLPVGKYSTRLTTSVGDNIKGFAQDYLSSSANYITIMRPSGSGNADAATSYARKVLKKLVSDGIPKDQITIAPYDAQTYGDAAPIRLVYNAISASTGPCGKWEEDMFANNTENKNYSNFGCATQQNIAAQIANPLDLVRPRGLQPVDAARRATAIGTYQTDGAGLGVQ